MFGEDFTAGGGEATLESSGLDQLQQDLFLGDGEVHKDVTEHFTRHGFRDFSVPLSPGYEKVGIAPADIEGLGNAEGSFPTGGGTFRVKITRSGGKRVVSVFAPRKVEGAYPAEPATK